MARNLIIVESPSKAKTIKKYLGSNYSVKSSVGHIIDLPKSTLGIDIENDYQPKYITVRGKTSILKEIKLSTLWLKMVAIYNIAEIHYLQTI